MFSVDETFLGNGNEIPSQTLRPGVDSTALSTEMALVSNALAAYTYLAGMREAHGPKPADLCFLLHRAGFCFWGPAMGC